VPDGGTIVQGIVDCDGLIDACNDLLSQGVHCDNVVLGGHGIIDVGFRSTYEDGGTRNRIYGCTVLADGGTSITCPGASSCLQQLGGNSCVVTIAACTVANNAQACTQALADELGCTVQAANGSCQAGDNCYGVANNWITAAPEE
jgi:hypothetical protein